jgi:hypothetical protein
MRSARRVRSAKARTLPRCHSFSTSSLARRRLLWMWGPVAQGLLSPVGKFCRELIRVGVVRSNSHHTHDHHSSHHRPCSPRTAPHPHDPAPHPTHDGRALGVDPMPQPQEEMVDKRRARQGSVGGNLTPKQAKDLLAVPVYALLNGSAVPIFPGTSLSGPSGLVGIFRKPGYGCRGLPTGKATAFPCWVNGTQWERAVVPVLADPQWLSTNLLFQQLASNNLSYLVNAIGEALAQSFHDAGYGPLPTS